MLLNLLTAMGAAIQQFSLAQSVLATTSVCLLVTWAVRRRSTWSLPPGPAPLPILGNVRQLKGKSLANTTAEWAREFGSVITIYLGITPTVVISSIEAMDEAYHTRGDDFADKPHSTSVDLISDDGSDIAFAPISDEVKYRRKVVMQSLRQYLTGDQHTDRIHSIVDMTLDNIQKQNGAFYLQDQTFFAVFNVLHVLCMGNTLEIDDPELDTFHKFMQNTSGKFGGLWEDFFPFLKYWPTEDYKILDEGMTMFKTFLRRHLAECKQSWDGESLNNLMENMLHTKLSLEETHSTHNEGFTETVMINIMSDVFFAGIDTTRNTLEWFFLILASNQDIQEKIQDEIDLTVGKSVPGREHRSGLVYTEAVIMEVMRLYPVVPIGLPHVTCKDTQLQGYDIPRGTAVLVNLYAIMRDPRHWEDADTFRPERFLDEDLVKPRLRPPSWVPFSSGARSCVGEFLARQNLLYIVTGLMQKVTLTPAPGEILDLEATAEWFSPSCKPFKVVATQRD